MYINTGGNAVASSEEEVKEGKQKNCYKVKNLSDVFCVAADIKKDWDERGWNKKNWIEDTIIRKFRKLLKDIGLENETKWYQSISREGRSEVFIFRNKKDAPEKMHQLFDIFYRNRGLISEKEKRVIADILIDLLPVERSVDRMNEILNQSKEYLSKEDTSEDNENPLDDSNISEAHKNRIWRAVYDYAPDMLDYFLNRILVEISGKEIPSKRIREQFYEFQYKEIKSWRDRWKSVMDYAAAVRIAERFENGYEVCREEEIEKEERQAFYKKGSCSNQALQAVDLNSDRISPWELYEALDAMQTKGLMENPQYDENIRQNAMISCDKKEMWRNQYIDLVSEIHNNELKKISKCDFAHMSYWALKELKAVGCKAERKRKEKIYCSELKDRTAEDLKKLFYIREVIDSKKRTVFDLLSE